MLFLLRKKAAHQQHQAIHCSPPAPRMFHPPAFFFKRERSPKTILNAVRAAVAILCATSESSENHIKPASIRRNERSSCSKKCFNRSLRGCEIATWDDDGSELNGSGKTTGVVKRASDCIRRCSIEEEFSRVSIHIHFTYQFLI